MNILEIHKTLAARQPLAPLFPANVWDASLSKTILALETSDVTRAGLLLWNDDLAQSHILSQSIETPTGSLWHAVMHRREGDASNAIYWWKNVGEHPAFALLQPRALKLLASQKEEHAQNFAAELRQSATWQPESFVRACERGGAWCEQLQHLEFEVFLDWCRAND